uniref:Bola-like protein n=1 Tax=Panagrolaimus sp. JU765 TaxID=591449 RepID=A0AC34QAS8_9BILA
MLKQFCGFFVRNLSTTTVRRASETEQKIAEKLKQTFKNAKVVQAEDISGGCGSMYRIVIESPEFAGIMKIKQHKMVTECLKDDIKSWHGIVIETKASS